MSTTGTPSDPSALPSLIGSVIRSVLGVVGGWLIGKGYVTADQMPEIIGGAVALFTAGWSFWQKLQAHKQLTS